MSINAIGERSSLREFDRARTNHCQRPSARRHLRPRRYRPHADLWRDENSQLRPWRFLDARNVFRILPVGYVRHRPVSLGPRRASAVFRVGMAGSILADPPRPEGTREHSNSSDGRAVVVPAEPGAVPVQPGLPEPAGALWRRHHDDHGRVGQLCAAGRQHHRDLAPAPASICFSAGPTSERR